MDPWGGGRCLELSILTSSNPPAGPDLQSLPPSRTVTDRGHRVHTSVQCFLQSYLPTSNVSVTDIGLHTHLHTCNTHTQLTQYHYRARAQILIACTPSAAPTANWHDHCLPQSWVQRWQWLCWPSTTCGQCSQVSLPLTRPANSKNLTILSSSAEPAKQATSAHQGLARAGREGWYARIPAGADSQNKANSIRAGTRFPSPWVCIFRKGRRDKRTPKYKAVKG